LIVRSATGGSLRQVAAKPIWPGVDARKQSEQNADQHRHRLVSTGVLTFNRQLAKRKGGPDRFSKPKPILPSLQLPALFHEVTTELLRANSANDLPMELTIVRLGPKHGPIAKHIGRVLPVRACSLVQGTSRGSGIPEHLLNCLSCGREPQNIDLIVMHSQRLLARQVHILGANWLDQIPSSGPSASEVLGLIRPTARLSASLIQWRPTFPKVIALFSLRF